MYDFLFVYEVKNRELENICLLKIELEHRGYTVKLVETWYRELYYSDKDEAKVVVTFALYNDSQILFLNNYAKNIKKIVNLQWEQVFTVADEENPGSLYNIIGNAKYAVHISWGQFNNNRLINRNAVSCKNAPICGHITLDFYKPLLRGYYQSREKICNLYGIDPKKRIHLFVSSFSWCELPDAELMQEVYQKLSFDPFEFKRISIESQNIILDWYEKVAALYPQIEFIYRPHPAEIGNERLENISNKYNNFHVINQESVKQWILIADDITTWYSTSIAEIYAADRTCAVLRPIEIPKNMDIRYYLECDKIQDFDNFNLFTCGKIGKTFPIQKKLLEEYYYFNQNKYTFMTICDVLENVYNDESYSYDYSIVTRNLGNNGSKNSVKNIIKSILPEICFKERKKVRLAYNRFLLNLIHKKKNGGNSKKGESLLFTEKMIMNNYSTEREIEEICDRLKNTIEKNKTILQEQIDV